MDKKAQQELEKTAARIHAQAVLERLKSMSCPAEEKVRILDAVKRCLSE